MVHRPPAQDVAEAFADQYYAILGKNHEILHKFYQVSSLMGWQGLDGHVNHVTFEGINDKVSSTDYRHCIVKLETIDSQESQDGAVFVMVTGSFICPNNERKKFSQAFFLAEQETGYFVLNDILRVTDIHGTKSVHSSSASNSVSENEVKEVAYHAVHENTTAEESTVEGPLHDNTMPSAYDTKSKAPRYKSDFPEIAAPVSMVNVVEAQPSTVAEKVSYASVLIRDTHLTPPSTTNITPKDKTPASSVRAEVASGQGIYIRGLPRDITKEDVLGAIDRFGALREHSNAVRIQRHQDGFVCALVDFESAESAQSAVKARCLKFGDKMAYISHKRTPSFQGKESGRSSFTRFVPLKFDKSGEDKTNNQAKLGIRTHSRSSKGKPLASLEETADDQWKTVRHGVSRPGTMR